MFGHAYFGRAYFGAGWFGPAGSHGAVRLRRFSGVEVVPVRPARWVGYAWIRTLEETDTFGALVAHGQFKQRARPVALDVVEEVPQLRARGVFHARLVSYDSRAHWPAMKARRGLPSRAAMKFFLDRIVQGE